MVRVTLPVHAIDLRDEKPAVARAIDDACRDTGFLLLSGHGVPQELCDRMLDACDEFYALPIERKRRLFVEDPAANRGYTGVGEEALAYTIGEETPPDLFEALTVGREDATGPYFDEHRSYFEPNVWPAEMPGLRGLFLEYEEALRRVQRDVLAAMDLALGLPDGWFGECTRDAIITTRSLLYERQAGAGPPVKNQMRLGAHTDYGVLTLLLADEIPGLQVRRDGAWHDVVPPRGTLIGNIGDLLARWTNDRWRSTLHRVVPPPPDGSDPVRRRAIARFLDGEPARVIECIPSCATPEHPPRYEPVHAGEWLRAKIVGGRTRSLAEYGGERLEPGHGAEDFVKNARR
jgi:isopenicillin N synthase-like dioxygenase